MNIDQKAFQMVGSFLRDICKSFPEAKGSIYRHYESVLLDYESKTIDECPLLQEFLQIIHENKDLISQRNHLFFLDDTPLIKDLSLKRVWDSSISEKTRGTIWKYLETISIINISIHSNKELQKALASFGTDEPMEIKDKKTAQDLQELKQLSEKVTQEAEPETTEGGGFGDIMGDLSGLMDSNIGSIAKEVAESSDIQEMFGSMDENANPMEMMQKLMQGDAMGNIFKNINQTIEKRVESGEMSEDALKTEADGMYGTMSQNPMFKNMMNPTGEGTKEETRDKLKQKIKQKQDGRKKN